MNGPCRECGGYCARPAVTLFGEPCPHEECAKAHVFLNELTSTFGSEEDASIVLLIGTSGMVNTIFEYIGQAQSANKYIVLIDPHPSPKMLPYVNAVVREKADFVFSS